MKTLPGWLRVWYSIALLLVVLLCFSCSDNKPVTLNIAFYNCENLFDTLNNPYFDDDDFTPYGTYHYTAHIYRTRLHNIATVLAGMEPALVGLAEVENATVLQDLCYQPELRNDDWQYVCLPGSYHRGLNVALLYQSAVFTPVASRLLPVPGIAQGVTRDILYVVGTLYGDTVHILVNHWPSRRGGDSATHPARLAASGLCAGLVKDIRTRNSNARILVMGDFNDNPTDASMTNLASNTMAQANRVGMYNPFAAIHASGTGTEVYKHNWNLFDQILVSPAFLATGGWQFTKASVYAPGFMRAGKNGYPRRAFLGTHWASGYSDHFPVVVTLRR